ncbi:MAG: hypothetical protein AAFP22_07525 [Planctomycetota bacterium]
MGVDFGAPETTHEAKSLDHLEVLLARHGGRFIQAARADALRWFRIELRAANERAEAQRKKAKRLEERLRKSEG